MTGTEAPNLSALPDLQAMSRMDGRVRQVATDTPTVERAIETARAHLSAARSAGNQRAMIRILGYLGERLAGRLDEADATLSEALTASRLAKDARSIVVGLIRLGELRRCQDRYADAEVFLREALAIAEDPGHPECAMYRDFALQHLGKTVLDAGRRDEAVALLERALTIRTASGAASLIASTEQALRRARWNVPAEPGEQGEPVDRGAG